MGLQARASAKRKYCTNDMIPRYEAYYRSVLGRRRPPASDARVLTRAPT